MKIGFNTWVLGNKGFSIEETLQCLKNKGIEGNNHCLLQNSDYRSVLLKQLKELHNLPIILEVEAKEDFEQTIKQELNYVREALK